MEDRLGLAEVISTLRSDLYRAMVDGAGELVKFEVGPVDLEFKVEVAREGGGGGKIRFWVIEAGADAKATQSSIQTLRLRLDPKDAVTGGPLAVADKGPIGEPGSGHGTGGGPQPA